MAKLGRFDLHRCHQLWIVLAGAISCPRLRSLGTGPIVLIIIRPRHPGRVALRMQPLLPRGPRARHSALRLPRSEISERPGLRMPMDGPFPLDDAAGAEECDIVVVGQRTRCGTCGTPGTAVGSLFLGEGLSAKRTVSYAATFGNHPRADGLEPYWAERLRKFDGSSVRDDNSRAIIEKDWDARRRRSRPMPAVPETISFGPNALASRPYIAVYGHSFPSWFQHTIRHWADDALAASSSA